jgi:hypothetical protein
MEQLPLPGPDPYLRTYLIEALRRRRARLKQAYAVHVCWLVIMCTLGAINAAQWGVSIALCLTLLTVPPVLIFNVLVHRSCRALDPASRTVGVWAIVIFTVFLTPFESGLVLPARNLMVSRKLLRKLDDALARSAK